MFPAGPCKAAYALKNPQLLESFQPSPFIGKGGGPWLVVANFLVLDHLFLRSGHRQVTMLLEASTRANVILCFDKGQSAKAQLPLSKAQAKPRGPWAGPFLCPGALVQHPVCPSTSAQALLKRQSSAGGALRGGSPEPAQPSSLREPGAQHPASPWAFHLNWSESFGWDQ